MTTRPGVIFALGLSALVADAAAHPLEAVESALRAREPHVRFVDTQLPGLRLGDDVGGRVALADMRGKVVVLNFVNAHGKEAHLHMALIARLQAMANVARMHDQVQFLTVATDATEARPLRRLASGFVQTYGLNASNWRLVCRTDTQPPRSARADGLDPHDQGLAKVVTHVIDQTGRLRARFYGLAFEPVNLVSYVSALVTDDHSRQ